MIQDEDEKNEEKLNDISISENDYNSMFTRLDSKIQFDGLVKVL